MYTNTALKLMNITRNEFDDMKLIDIVKKHTILKRKVKGTEEEIQLNEAFSVLSDLKRNANKLIIEDSEETEYDFSTKTKVTPIVRRSLNNLKIRLPIPTGSKLLVAELGKFFDGAGKDEFIITPNTLKKGSLIIGVNNDNNVYEIDLK